MPEPLNLDQVSGLVALALREKVPVEVLERLVALQERVADKDARAVFFGAVAAVQEAVTEIPKTKTAKIETAAGGTFTYTFAPLEAITRTIRPLLKKHGLSYSWTTEPGAAGFLNVICVLRHIEGHEERASFPVPTATKAAMSEAQKHGAALTYGKRQSLTSVLGLTAADPDTDAPAEDTSEEISDEQLANLEDLLLETGADRTKFLDYFNLGTLSQITTKQYPAAVRALEKKRRVRI